MRTHAFFISALISSAIAAPVAPSASCPPPEEPQCHEFLVPVQASANNTLFPAYPDSTAAGAVYQYIGSLRNATIKPFANPVSGTFNISAKYCEPAVSLQGRNKTIQLLVHGLGYTKSYWNGLDYPILNFPTEYSWTAHAASQGYATLAIDSLGNGLSDHPEPLNTVQLPLQVEILRLLIASLRAGSIKGIPVAFDKVILASYSFGSITARYLATTHPNDGADAYVLTAAARNLTGFQSAFVTFQARAASVVDPKRFGNLSPGYLDIAGVDVRDTVYSFDGDFSPLMLSWDIAATHAFAVGEIASGQLAPTGPSNFTGPVFVLTGRYDQIACGAGNFSASVGDCGVGPNAHPTDMGQLFPKARLFGSYITDHTGHSLNTHYPASESFGAVHQWLESAGF